MVADEVSACWWWMLVLLAVGTTVKSQGQETILENAANEFIVGFTVNNDMVFQPSLLLFVTTPETNPVTFMVTANGFNFTGTAFNDSSTEVSIPSTFQVTSDSERNKGIYVKAERESKIVVYGLSYRQTTSDEFLALPCSNLAVEEYEYYAMTYPDRRSHLTSDVLIVGCEDNTLVTTPSNTITLNRLETYLIESSDSTGMRVTSTKPVSFFSNQKCTKIPTDINSCDHLTEQIPPTSTWGTYFYAASLLGRNSGELFRILSAKDSTTVRVNCTTFSQAQVYNLSLAGNWEEFEIRPLSFCTIESSAPILVTQFALGSGRDGMGDPFMMMIPPVEQYSNNYVLKASSSFSTNCITIYVGRRYYQPSRIFVDDISRVGSSWTPVNCSDGLICGYITRVNLTAGEHRIFHQDPCARIGVSVYGFSGGNSYGYPGGLKLTSIQYTGCPRLPESVIVTSITPTGVTIQWMLTQPFNAAGPETFVVLYGTTQNGLTRTSTSMVIANATSQTYSIQLNSLDIGTQYYFKVQSRNMFESVVSNVIVFTTDDTMSGPVTDLQTNSPDNSTLVISWRPPTTPNGNIISYTVRIDNVKDGTTLRDIMDHSEAMTSLTENDLVPGVPYRVSVAAVNRADQGSITTLTNYTKELEPTRAPKIIKVDRIHPTVMLVSWTPLTLSEARGFITNYTVFYSPQVNRTRRQEPNTMQKAIGGDVNQTTIDGLDSNTAYDVQMSANTKAGASSLSEVISAPVPSTEFTGVGCPLETDGLWQIIWPNTPPNITRIQRCPEERNWIGNVSRYCDGNGVWSDPDVLSCTSIEFATILVEALEAFSSNDSSELLNQTVNVTSRLVEATSGREISLLPSDLQITNNLLNRVINILLEDNTDVMQQSSETGPDENDVVSIFNNVLDENNTAGWTNLQKVVTMNGSELLLNNAERYGLVLAREVKAPRRLSRPNIALSASQFDTFSPVTDEDLSFPSSEDLVNYTSEITPILASIPKDLITEKLSNSSSVPVVHILFNNLEDFLPPSSLDSSESPNGISTIYSVQIGERGVQSRVLLDTPINLEFTFSNFENTSSYKCAFWNFSKPIGSGGFSTDGVITASISIRDDVITVQCLSYHTTSFAVLVDVAGGLQTASEGELKALQTVSYVGCSISIICLSLTVLFFLTQRKKISRSANFFVHLNLAATLFVALVVFVFGIELGKITAGVCLSVALLLHYLFLSAFCWMLCEGILLYFLLVVVLSKIPHQRWIFILIGYVSPIPIVVISVASRHDYYGVRNSEGVLQYCWLSVEKGTVYAFVAPMLLVILINVVVLVLSLKTLLRIKKKQYSHKTDEEATFAIAKSLFIASVVLLPLLGLTWIFGILTINSSSTVFAWLFTIFNSVQGAGIFFFHVVRNETVWSKIHPRLPTLSSKVLGKAGNTRLHTSEASSVTKESKDTNIYSKGKGSAFPRGASVLKVRTDSNLSKGFINSLTIEETKIDLGRKPDEC